MFTLATLIICGAVVLWYVLTFNGLVNARNAVDQAWSHIEVELKRRLDLIQNLVEVAKGYAKHERETFTEIAALRNQARPFGDAAAANAAEPNLSKTIGNIMVLAENYPQLRSDQSFLNLQKELTETENRIADRRHSYNQSTNVYLNKIRSVPSNIVASIQDFQPRTYFDAPDAEIQQPPKIELT
jgi:LemA protein